MNETWFVYIIRTEKDKLYTGISTNLERRFNEHLATHEGIGKKGAKYFRSDKPLQLVYQESYPNRAEASRRESEIKSLSSKAKQALLKEG